MQAFVPKNRRPKFMLMLRIVDLQNVPLVSGTCYVKWHLPSSTSAEHRGRTSKAGIREHRVSWDYEKSIPVRLVIDRNGMLQDTEIHFEILQEYSFGARAERITLGNIRLNLAQYVNSEEVKEGGISRRYLMQDSKINSTLKLVTEMKQTEGDRDFTAPPLKTAPVFGGIAGIMSSERVESDELGHIPTSSGKTREQSKLQNMYRRMLAASYDAQIGELPADQAIEDIFAGGDGWGKGNANDRNVNAWGSSRVDDDKWSVKTHTPKSPGRREGRNRSASARTSNGRPSTPSQGHSSLEDLSDRQPHEIDEFEAREDLRSWIIRPQA